MTYDQPFRVERTTRYQNGAGRTLVTTFAIVRTGGDTVCTCDDVSYAYRIVELLNEDELTSEVGR